MGTANGTGSRYALLFAAMVLLVQLPGMAVAADFVFETAVVQYILSDSGLTTGLREKATGRDLLARPLTPFATVAKQGRFYPVSGLKRAGELFRADFGQSGISADYRISAKADHILFELVQVYGTGVDEIRLCQVRTSGFANSGTLLPVAWDKQFALSLMSLSDKVDSRFGEGMLLSSVYREFGMIGERSVLIAVPTPRFLDTVRSIEQKYSLPSPKIGGAWAKTSRDVRSSYLFIDMTEANADEVIRYAKLGGFQYILIYSNTWSSSLGSYPINTVNFPRGEESLKAVIGKVHAAGLKAGMHMLTSFVGKSDVLVSTGPQRLLGDADAVLATPLDAASHEITAVSGMAHFPARSNVVRIDNELIRYEALGGSGSTMLLRCTRGYGGTLAASHQAGAPIQHLAEFYGAYVADLRSTLKDEIADRIAGLINRCGFDMIYFDGGEVNCATGPCWYWGSQQQMSVWKRVTRDLLVQGSGLVSWTWHIFSRGNSDDFAAIAPKQFLDYRKIPDYWNSHYRSFLPAELGWWGFLASAPDHPATTPDEVRFYAARMLALDSPVSLETTVAALHENGRTEEMFRLLAGYEKQRLGNAVPAAARDRLRSGEWIMDIQAGKPVFRPVRYDNRRIEVPGEISVGNENGLQKLKFRMQAVPALAKVGDPANATLVRADSPILLNPPTPGSAMPGALAGRIETGAPGKPLDLTIRRALAVRLKVEGAVPVTGAVLNIQLEAGGKTYRDHYIDLDFNGERTVIIPESNAERMLPEFRPALSSYSFKAALYGFQYKNIVAVNFRWMRQPAAKPVKCTITLVEALAEKESVLSNPSIAIGAAAAVLPVTLRSGDYVEIMDQGPARVFDRNGVQLSTFTAPDMPVLRTGENRISISGTGVSAVKLTTLISGNVVTR